MTTARRITSTIASAVLVIGAVGCGSDTAGPATTPVQPPVAAASAGVAVNTEIQVPLGQRTVIDVRTPAEFADGHIDGALNFDVGSDDFAQRILELPKDAAYTIYCRSGQRAGHAVEIMAGAGFTDVVNAGSLEQAAEAIGADIVLG